MSSHANEGEWGHIVHSTNCTQHYGTALNLASRLPNGWILFTTGGKHMLSLAAGLPTPHLLAGREWYYCIIPSLPIRPLPPWLLPDLLPSLRALPLAVLMLSGSELQWGVPSAPFSSILFHATPPIFIVSPNSFSCPYVWHFPSVFLTLCLLLLPRDSPLIQNIIIKQRT